MFVAKHQKRRRRSRLVVVNIEMSVALGTLNANTVIRDSPSAGELFSRSLFVISSDLYCSMRGTTGEGPIQIGWAHDDLSVAEILEGIQADTADRNDQIALERAGRKIRTIGVFPALASEGVLNDGKNIRTRLGFMVDTGSGVALYALNRSGAQLTTGAVVDVFGKLYCRAA